MRTISNKQFDAILRLLSDFLTADKEQTTQGAERRRKAMKTVKYLKRRKQ